MSRRARRATRAGARQARERGRGGGGFFLAVPLCYSKLPPGSRFYLLFAEGLVLRVDHPDSPLNGQQPPGVIVRYHVLRLLSAAPHRPPARLKSTGRKEGKKERLLAPAHARRFPAAGARLAKRQRREQHDFTLKDSLAD